MASEFVQRARSFVEQGKLQDAVRVCRLGLLSSPSDVEGRLVLGAALLALLRLDEVLAEMGSALNLSPNNPSALALKGDALLRKGDAEKALQVLNKAAAASPNDPYVEGLQAAAKSSIASGFKPSETIDIDPDLIPELNSGVELDENDSNPFDVPTRVATPFDDMESMVLSESDIIEQPFADIHNSGHFTSDALPMAIPQTLQRQGSGSAPMPALPEPNHLQTNPATNQPPAPQRHAISPAHVPPAHVPSREGHWERNFTEAPNRPATIGTLFPDDAVDPITTGRPATIGTLFPDDEVPRQVASPPSSQPRLATIGSLFPDTPVPVRAPTVGDLVAETQAQMPPRPNTAESMGSRARSSDMDLIRGAVEPKPSTLGAIRARASRQIQGLADTSGAGGFPLVGWLAVLLFASAGGAWGGLQIRDARLSRDIQQVQRDAEKVSASGTYLGARKARDYYGRVAEALPSDRSRSALARSQALLVAEFGEASDAAQKGLNNVSDSSLLDAQVASAYLSIAAGKDAEAQATSNRIVESEPANPLGHYLLGWSFLLAGDSTSAVSAIQKSIELGATSFAYVALSRAQAMAGRYSDALASVSQTSPEGALSLPKAIIWQARILLVSGELPQNPSDPDDRLAEIVQMARSSDLGEVSAVQGAWAGLILAQVKLDRGDIAAAKKALAEAKIGRPSDWTFSEMLLEVLLGLGDLSEAKSEAVAAQVKWPERMTPQIVSAEISLRQGKPDEAMALLSKIDGLENSARAMTIRGRIFLAQGEIELAVADLDDALAKKPKFVAAGVARAKVDMLRGDARAAIGRLGPMYKSKASSKLAVAYAEALRESGKIDEAREVLLPKADSTPNVEVLVGLAELEERAGNWDEAAIVYQRAITLDPRAERPRLGAALLEIDQGEVLSGRESMEALLREGPASGLVYVESARARIMTGDLDGANELLLRPESGVGWLNWRVARARGRMLLNRQKPVEAVSQLQRAQSLRPEDIETRVLLMEAYFEFRNRRGSGRALQEITKSFRESSLRQLASGIHSLLQEDTTLALASLHEARSRMLKERASRLQLSRVAYWLGRAYYNADDLQRAEEWLGKATKLNQAYASAYYWLGQVQHLQQKSTKMVASYEAAVSINPSRNPLAWFFLGVHYEQANDTEKAVKALESFLQYYPEDSGDVVIEAKGLLAKIR